jgi:cell division protein FtsW (lipid II flippase)
VSDKPQKKVVLELVVMLFTGLVVIGALVAALNYDFVSARAPLIIIVPLLILIVVQFNKKRKEAQHLGVFKQLSHAFKGHSSEFNSVLRFILFMTLLLLLIYVAGHYIGVSVFMFALMYWVSGEKFSLSILVSIGITVLLYFLFEEGFNIELYRGYIPRLLADYGLI